MKPFAVLFMKKPKGEAPKATMVILAKRDQIVAYGLPGISGIMIDDMNEQFQKVAPSDLLAEAQRLRETYKPGGTGYGSSISIVDYEQNKRKVDADIRRLLRIRSDSVIGKSNRGRV
jgi:hypothetical protein